MKGIKNSKYYMLSAFFYGLTIYCYSAIWIIIPVIVFLQLLYVLLMKKLKPDIFLLIAFLILCVMATPALLFILVNSGYIEEIRTGFISIPKMLFFRGGDISVNNIPANLLYTAKMLFLQNDELIWNSIDKFGIYYHGAQLFSLIGFGICIRQIVVGIKKKQLELSVFLMIQFIAALLIGATVQVNITRINAIHISIVAFNAIGLMAVINLIAKKIKIIKYIAIVGMLGIFVLFMGYYIKRYVPVLGTFYQDGIIEAVDKAMDLSNDNETAICVRNVYYPKILLLAEVSPGTYINETEYEYYPSAYLHPTRIGNIYFEIPPENEECVYIVSYWFADEYRAQGYQVITYKEICVAYK